MATAIQRDDPRRHPIEFEQTEEGLVASLPFIVNSTDRVEALQADGLPAYGAEFSPLYPNLRMRAKRHESIEGSWSWVRVYYRERTVTYPTGGYSFTEIQPSPVSTNVGYTAETPPRKLPSGGAMVEIIQRQVLVHHFHNNPPDVDFSDVDSYLTPINSDELVLPPQASGNNQVIIPPGLARYRGSRSAAGPRGTVEIVHELAVAGKDWNFRFYPTNADGLLDATETAAPIYPSKALMPILA